MEHRNYYARILHRPASRARVLLNGIPIYDRTPTRNVAPTEPATQWLRRGENSVTVELFPAPRPETTPYLDPYLVVSMLTHDDQREEQTVFSWEYPKSRIVASLPTKLPLLNASVFTVSDPLPAPAYLRATPEDFPVEGTQEQRAAVAMLYQAFARGNASGFEAAMDLKASETDRFYGSKLGERAAAVARLSEPWVMDPFNADDLRFDRYLDGRVAFVHRASGKPAVRAIHRDDPRLGWGTDFFMTRLDGHWQIYW